MSGKVTIRRKPFRGLTRGHGRGGVVADLLHRLGWGVLLILLCAAASVVLLLALGVLDAARLPAFLPEGPVAVLEALAPVERLAIAAGAVVVGVAAALMLASPGSRRGRRGRASTVHVLERDERGMVVVASQSVGTVARAAALRVPGILDAEVRRIRSANGPATLRLRAWVLAGTEVRSVGEEVRDGVQDAVERLVGLTVRSVHVEMEVVAPEDEIRMLE
ncbi:MAG: hypothetical protein ACQEXJ_07560 [Myxococcota bacterium]